MRRVEVSLEENVDFSFLPIVNFLVSNGVLPLAEGAILNRNFQSGDVVVFDIPDATTNELVRELDYHSWTYRIDTIIC